MKRYGPRVKIDGITWEEEIEVLQAQLDEDRILNGEYLDDPYVVIPYDEEY